MHSRQVSLLTFVWCIPCICNIPLAFSHCRLIVLHQQWEPSLGLMVLGMGISHVLAKLGLSAPRIWWWPVHGQLLCFFTELGFKVMHLISGLMLCKKQFCGASCRTPATHRVYACFVISQPLMTDTFPLPFHKGVCWIVVGPRKNSLWV